MCKKYRDAVKIIRVINSCESVEQLEVVKRMVKAWIKLYRVEYYTICELTGSIDYNPTMITIRRSLYYKYCKLHGTLQGPDKYAATNDHGICDYDSLSQRRVTLFIDTNKPPASS